MTVSDQLAKFDPELEGLTMKLVTNWKTLLEGQHQSELLVGDSKPEQID